MSGIVTPAAHKKGETLPLVVAPRKPKDSTLIVWTLGFLLILGIGAMVTFFIISIDVSPSAQFLPHTGVQGAPLNNNKIN